MTQFCNFGLMAWCFSCFSFVVNFCLFTFSLTKDHSGSVLSSSPLIPQMFSWTGYFSPRWTNFIVSPTLKASVCGRLNSVKTHLPRHLSTFPTLMLPDSLFSFFTQQISFIFLVNKQVQHYETLPGETENVQRYPHICPVTITTPTIPAGCSPHLHVWLFGTAINTSALWRGWTTHHTY